MKIAMAINDKEIWKEFTKNESIIYEASNMGRFRRIGKTKINYLKPFKRNCIERKNHRNRSHSVIIKAYNDGKYKEYNCNRLLASLFIRELKPNDVVINKNGNRLDLKVSNLFITTKNNLGRITGGKSSKAKQIAYYDNIDFRTIYPSARNLAKKLGVSYQTVLDIANKEVKKPKYKILWVDEL